MNLPQKFDDSGLVAVHARIMAVADDAVHQLLRHVLRLMGGRIHSASLALPQFNSTVAAE
jgi:hypothetical protein